MPTYYEKNKESILKKTAAYKKANPLKHKMHKLHFELKNKYKISIDQYLSLFESQNNQCAICLTEVKPYTKHSHIDHCHESGRVRGILCKSCNNGIGFLKDSKTLLKRAASYLEGLCS